VRGGELQVLTSLITSDIDNKWSPGTRETDGKKNRMCNRRLLLISFELLSHGRYREAVKPNLEGSSNILTFGHQLRKEGSPSGKDSSSSQARIVHPVKDESDGGSTQNHRAHISRARVARRATWSARVQDTCCLMHSHEKYRTLDSPFPR